MDVADTHCVFCTKQVEEIEHLYFSCNWTGECLVRVKKWLEWSCIDEKLPRIIRRLQRSKMTIFRKKVVLTTLAALVYEIWKARNWYIWKNEIFSMERMISQLRIVVKNRVVVLNCKKVGDIDWEWFLQL